MTWRAARVSGWIATVNLKCPVAIHPETRAARQVILEADSYEMRHPLAQFRTEEGAPC